MTLGLCALMRWSSDLHAGQGQGAGGEMTDSGWGSSAGSEMNDRSRSRRVPFRDEEGLMSLILVRGICQCPHIDFSSSRGDDAGTDTSLQLGSEDFEKKGC